MITRDKLVRSKEYWLAKIQAKLFAELEDYMEENGLNRTQLAEKLGVTKGYVSQVLNGDFDHRLSKLIELSLLIGKAPIFDFLPVEKYEVNKSFQEVMLPFEEQIELNKGYHTKIHTTAITEKHLKEFTQLSLKPLFYGS